MDTSLPLYLCYIDEAGDEGFQFNHGSSQWFLMSCVIVKQSDEKQVRNTVDRIFDLAWTKVNQTPPKMLHWRNLDHNRKILTAMELANQPFAFISVAIDKSNLTKASFICNPGNLFRYTSKLLLERVSWYVKEQHGKAHITFSNRKKFQPELLRTYFQKLRLNGANTINWVFDPLKIEVRDNMQLNMLQIADSCCGATYNAICCDNYGNTHPYYLGLLKGQLYKRNGLVVNYGIKVLPNITKENENLYPLLEGL